MKLQHRRWTFRSRPLPLPFRVTSTCAASPGAADVDPRVQEFRVHFDLEGPDAEQAAMLAEQFSMRCPIYTTLIKAAPIVITTNEEEMGGPVAEGLATAEISASLSNQPGRAIVNVRNDYLVVDSVPPLGGPNLEVNPLDLLLAAKASCGAVIMERAAIDQGIPLDGVKGTVEADFDPQGLHRRFGFARHPGHARKLGNRHRYPRTCADSRRRVGDAVARSTTRWCGPRILRSRTS